MHQDTKRCSTCRLSKARGEFNRHSRSKDGLQYECRDCSRAGNVSWRLQNAERSADEKRFRKYGITPDAFKNLLAEQGGLCAICSDYLTHPQLDHCHSTGRVRGILCRPCNVGLGYFADDTKRLRSAISYLSR